jgi:MFS family permease
MLGAVLAQQGVRRFGVRAVSLAGLALATAGLALLTTIPVNGTYAANLLPGLLLMSAGMGLLFVPITLIATSNVSDEDAGPASGILTTSQQVGGALGIAVLSTVAAGTSESLGAASPAALVAGWHDAFTGAASVLGAALVLLSVMLRRRDVDGVGLDWRRRPRARVRTTCAV